MQYLWVPVSPGLLILYDSLWYLWHYWILQHFLPFFHSIPWVLPNVWHWISVSVSIMWWVMPHWCIDEYSRISLRIIALAFFVIPVWTLPVYMETIMETTHPTQIHTHCRYPTPPTQVHTRPQNTHMHTQSQHTHQNINTHTCTHHKSLTPHNQDTHILTHTHTHITKRERTK